MPDTLFIGANSESTEAGEIVKTSEINSQVVDGTQGYFDFEPPLLISSWGVFEGLKSIKWFAEVTQSRLASS